VAAEADEPVEVRGPEQEPADDHDDDGWPTLSELDLGVCAMESVIAGAARAGRSGREP
jgi:hypothetical protein